MVQSNQGHQVVGSKQMGSSLSIKEISGSRVLGYVYHRSIVLELPLARVRLLVCALRYYECCSQLSKFGGQATADHMAAMKRTMKFVIGTQTHGLTLKPNQALNGNPDFEFTILGKSDSTMASEITTLRSEVHG